MRILSLVEAAKELGTPDLGTFVGGGDWSYPDPVPSYFIPEDSGAKVGLARVIANVFLDRARPSSGLPRLAFGPAPNTWTCLPDTDCRSAKKVCSSRPSAHF